MLARRTRYLLLPLLLVSVLAACTVPATTGWSQYRHDGTGSGNAAGEKQLTPANVGSLVLDYSTPSLGPNSGGTAQPVVSGGRVYVTAFGRLKVFDAMGVEGCSGSPKVCDPLWTAQLYGFGTASAPNTTPAVVGGLVLVTSTNSDHGMLEAFDATGTTNCAGTPKICTPLWRTDPLSTIFHPTVANGFVYVSSGLPITLTAYDAAGQAGCSGTPKVCTALWRGTTTTRVPNIAANSSVAVAVPLSPYDPIAAYPAQGCAGSPGGCAPLWQTAANNSVSGFNGYPTIVGDTVVAPINSDSGPVLAFDVNGVQNCSGTPTICEPHWTGNLPDPTGNPSPLRPMPVAGLASSGGLVYVPARPLGGGIGYTAAFDVAGANGCSGSPITCLPQFYTQGTAVAPTIANGVLFAGANAYDAAGVQNCSGTPKLCTPLWSTNVPGEAAVNGGRVYVATGGPTFELRAYRLP